MVPTYSHDWPVIRPITWITPLPKQFKLTLDDVMVSRLCAHQKAYGGRAQHIMYAALDNHLAKAAEARPPAKPKHRTLKELASLPVTLVWNEKIFRRGIARDRWNMIELHHMNATQEAASLNSGRTEPFWTGLVLGRADEMGLDVWGAYEAGDAVPFNPVTHGYLLLPPMTDEQEKAIQRANAA